MIYIVTKNTSGQIVKGHKQMYSFSYDGKTTAEVKNNFFNNLQDALLNNIIKQYYDGNTQPQ